MTTAASSRMTMVAIGVSVASLVYSSSLVAQRYVPDVKAALMVRIGDVQPTYYVRVLASAVVASIAATVGRHFTVSERALAWGTSIALAASMVLVCAFP